MNTHLMMFLKSNKKLILISLTLSVMILLVYLYSFYVPLYQSSASLFIKNISNGSVVTSYGNEEPLISESGYSNPLFNYQEIMHSELVAKHCYNEISSKYPGYLKKMGIHSEYQWIRNFNKLVETKVVPSTDVINISFKWCHQKTASEVAQLVLEALKLTNLEILRGVTLQQREFLDNQLMTISQELLDVRTQIKNFKLSNKAIDLGDETTELVRRRVELQQHLSSLHSNISFNQRKAKELVNILGVKDAQDAMFSNSIGNDPYLENLNGQLAELQKEYQGMAAKFTDAYPPMQALKNKIDSTTNNIAARQKEILGSYVVRRGIYNKASSDIVTDLARVQAEAASSMAQYKALQQGINALKSQEATIPNKKLALDELEKKELALANAYDSVKKKQMEAHIKETAIVNNIITLNDPTPGKLDIKQLLLVCVGFVSLGLMFGIGIAWIKEGVMDQWLNTDEVEQKTGKPVLGVLPWEGKKGKGKKDLANGLSCPKITDAVRTFDQLAQTVINRSYLENVKVISFCSLATERKDSPIVSQLALSLANAGHRVLLIDADMHAPSRHVKYFDPNQKVLLNNGLETLIPEVNKRIRLHDVGTSEEKILNDAVSKAVAHIEVKNETNVLVHLDYISTKNPQSRSYDFIASPGFKHIISYLKTRYDFVLIDSPALPMHFPEVDTVNCLSEGVVLLSPFSTKRTELIREIQRLDASGKNSLGIFIRGRQTA